MNCLQLTCQITGTFSVFTTAVNLDDRLWLSMITDSDYRPVLIVCWGGSVESCTVGIQTVSERGSRSSRGQQTQTRGWPPAWLSLSLPAHLFRTAARKINFISSVSLPVWPKHPEFGFETKTVFTVFSRVTGNVHFSLIIFNNLCWRQHSGTQFSTLHF